MAKKSSDKKEAPERIEADTGKGEEEAFDPYLNQLDSSLEDLMAEEPTRVDVKKGEPAAAPEPVKKKAALSPKKAAPAPVPKTPTKDEGLAVARDIPVEVRVVIGDKPMTLGDLLKLKKGELMELEKGLDAAVDLMVQDKVVARGELVEIDGRLGVRIVRVLEESS